MRSYLRPLLPLFVALATVYWVLLFIATHMPVTTDVGINSLDKYIHCAAYALLAFVIGSVLSIWHGYQTRSPIWIWTLAVAYGAIDEYTQRFTPSRTPDLVDFACDATGAALGLVALHLCVMATRSFRSSPASGVNSTPMEATAEI